MITTPIFAAGKRVGSVIGKSFIKRVNSSKHFLRQPPAIAFDLASLLQAEDAGAMLVEIFDKCTGKVYRTAISTIWTYGFEVNRGYGKQIALELPFWEVKS